MEQIGPFARNVKHIGHRGHTTVVSVGDVYAKWIITALGEEKDALLTPDPFP